MQLSVPWRSGQKIPFCGLPRINRKHPLAQGLVSYCLDIGGLYYDLVWGFKSTLYNNSVSPTWTIGSSLFGTGTIWPGSGSGNPGFNVPLPAFYAAASGQNAPFSYVCALRPVTSPAIWANSGSILFAVADSSGNGNAIGVGSSGNVIDFY